MVSQLQFDRDLPFGLRVSVKFDRQMAVGRRGPCEIDLVSQFRQRSAVLTEVFCKIGLRHFAAETTDNVRGQEDARSGDYAEQGARGAGPYNGQGLSCNNI